MSNQAPKFLSTQWMLCCVQTGDVMVAQDERPTDLSDVEWDDRLCAWAEVPTLYGEWVDALRPFIGATKAWLLAELKAEQKVQVPRPFWKWVLTRWREDHNACCRQQECFWPEGTEEEVLENLVRYLK